MGFTVSFLFLQMLFAAHQTVLQIAGEKKKLKKLVNLAQADEKKKSPGHK